MQNDTMIIIPTMRKPPLVTLEAYDVENFQTVVLCDPSVYKDHENLYTHEPTITVRAGRSGAGAQIFASYQLAAQLGFKWWVKFDDDLPEKTFIGIDEGDYPDLGTVITYLRECVETTGTTLSGLQNSTNRYWMNDEYKRTYGLLSGGACLACATENANQFIDPELKAICDVYRSLSHRKKDKAVGRVGFVGLDKSLHTGTGSTFDKLKQKDWDYSRNTILERFSGMVTCKGYREILGGSRVIPNWRLKQGGCFISSDDYDR